MAGCFFICFLSGLISYTGVVNAETRDSCLIRSGWQNSPCSECCCYRDVPKEQNCCYKAYEDNIPYERSVQGPIMFYLAILFSIFLFVVVLFCCLRNYSNECYLGRKFSGAGFIFERRIKKIEETCHTTNRIPFDDKDNQLHEINTKYIQLLEENMEVNKKYQQLLDENVEVKKQLKAIESRLQSVVDSTNDKDKLEEIEDNLSKISVTLTQKNNKLEQELNLATGNVRVLHETVFTSSAKLQRVEEIIMALTESNSKTAVAFSSRLETKIQNVGDGQTIVFDKVVTNQGNCYDSRHGHFTASIKGTYIFAVSIMGHRNEWLVVQLLQNESVIGYVHSEGTITSHESATGVFAVTLDIGDIVRVKYDFSGNGRQILETFTSFSGVLVNPM